MLRKVPKLSVVIDHMADVSPADPVQVSFARVAGLFCTCCRSLLHVLQVSFDPVQVSLPSIYLSIIHISADPVQVDVPYLYVYVYMICVYMICV